MIKNIIFDVGEVLLDYRWKDMLMIDHGMAEADAERVGKEVFNHPLWAKFDSGDITLKELVTAYGKAYPTDQTDIRWFLEHSERMPVPRKTVWDKIPRLKEKGYKIYLLSNYSQELFEKHTKNADFMNQIDGRLVSYEVHKIKPDPEIYRCLLERYHLKPEECIFFDDRKENADAATKLGIFGVHVVGVSILLEEINKLLKGKEDV